jgi:hypothetical protein
MGSVMEIGKWRFELTPLVRAEIAASGLTDDEIKARVLAQLEKDWPDNKPWLASASHEMGKLWARSLEMRVVREARRAGMTRTNA